MNHIANPTPIEVLTTSQPHLADFAFRAHTRTGRVSATRPGAGVEWSLAQTLAELRRRSVTLLATDHGVRVVSPRRPPAALARAVEAHGPALLVAMQLGVMDYTTPAPWAADEWDDLTRLRAAWFGLRFSPRVPFDVTPGVTVTDHIAFRAAVAADLAAGPRAVSAPALETTLATLFSKYGPTAPRQLRVLPPTRARAA